MFFIKIKKLGLKMALKISLILSYSMRKYGLKLALMLHETPLPYYSRIDVLFSWVSTKLFMGFEGVLRA